jgi:hypothetical protein
MHQLVGTPPKAEPPYLREKEDDCPSMGDFAKPQHLYDTGVKLPPWPSLPASALEDLIEWIQPRTCPADVPEIIVQEMLRLFKQDPGSPLVVKHQLTAAKIEEFRNRVAVHAKRRERHKRSHRTRRQGRKTSPKVPEQEGRSGMVESSRSLNTPVCNVIPLQPAVSASSLTTLERPLQASSGEDTTLTGEGTTLVPTPHQVQNQWMNLAAIFLTMLQLIQLGPLQVPFAYGKSLHTASFFPAVGSRGDTSSGCPHAHYSAHKGLPAVGGRGDTSSGCPHALYSAQWPG